MEPTQAIDGRVTAVRGAVLDFAFDGAALPPVNKALLIAPDNAAPSVYTDWRKRTL
jgi:hypothetical protein